jgi:hypothetical protein
MELNGDCIQLLLHCFHDKKRQRAEYTEPYFHLHGADLFCTVVQREMLLVLY